LTNGKFEEKIETFVRTNEVKKVKFARSRTLELKNFQKSRKSGKMKNPGSVDLSNHTRRTEKNFLNKCIKSSELLKLKAKLGNIVTKVDHSDIIIKGNLPNYSKNLLQKCGFDPLLYTLDGQLKLKNGGNPRPD
jgi:hypothetical protein